MRSKLAVLLLFGAIASLAAAQDEAENTSYVNKRAFFFRYKMENPRGKIVELRLYASRDAGPWVFTGRCLPNQPGFNFSTDQDGSYAFAVQAVYEGNQLDPPTNDLRADRQRVVIDTQQPRITLRPVIAQGGAAGVEWEVNDEHIDPNSVRLEYRWPDQASWLPLDREVAFRTKDSRSWDLKPGQKLEVRLRAQDLAKNEVVSPGVWTPPDPNQARMVESGRDNVRDPSTPLNPSRPTLFHVNNRRVKLEYDVKVGPSGLDRLELWVTSDGRDWKLDEKASGDGGIGQPVGLPDERAMKRALIFEAEKDGLYGFIINAKNKVGIGADPPKRGDPARVQVMIDTTKPTVRLLETKVRPNGDRAGAILDIAWDARDANIAPQPIDIEYAEKEEGPWRTIADRLDNTGRFTWTVGANEPYQFFVRVRCVDRAKNIGEDRTQKPVIVDLTVPSVEIKDVVPGAP